MGGLAGGLLGSAAAAGARQLFRGQRPNSREMFLTPANAQRLTEQLSQMRGAAMKMGQLLSLEAGDLLTPELAAVLRPLQSQAHVMPPAQLKQVLTRAWGADFTKSFKKFDVRPIAAASIGQVHRTLSPDGREIVLKLQYPGVAQSIDSDVDNIASLLRLSGLLPPGMDIQPLLDDAKRQLHDEADYLKEAKYLQAFGEALAGDERFVLPQVLPELTHRTALAMTWVDASPIDTVAKKPRAERDRVMSALIELMLLELFELRLVQTDPNFANYRYRPGSGEIVLLDFGATRRFRAGFVNNYRKLAAAAVAGDDDRVAAAAQRLGYAVGERDSVYRELMLEVFQLALEPLRTEGPYDFAGSNLAGRISELGEEITRYREFWHTPPSDAVFFHRKLGGMFMLATRLEARVDVHELLQRWL